MYATFSHGLMEGQAWIVYHDGGIAIAAVRGSSFHGVYKEFHVSGSDYAEDDAEEGAAYAAVRVGVRANGRDLPGSTQWVMDNVEGSAVAARVDAEGRMEAEDGCYFHFGTNIQLCGRFRIFQFDFFPSLSRISNVS